MYQVCWKVFREWLTEMFEYLVFISLIESHQHWMNTFLSGSLSQIWHMPCMQWIWVVCTRSVLSYHIPVYFGWMSVLMKCWITMMLLCFHGMVPLQYLYDIGAVTVRFLCNLTETHLPLIKLWIGVIQNTQIELICNSNQRSLDITISCSQNWDYYIKMLRIYVNLT